ncbi:hypothetical protein ACQRWP_23600 [Micromonospora trifolii]|uniref:hypothetical protein n=1 Tax=Micromonospora trifolii TaxID=2911208 RepID=UPI003D2ECAB6
MLDMGVAAKSLRAVLAINDSGLLLAQDDVGTWWIQGSADGLIYTAGDRLAWLLPLLERTPTDVRVALSGLPLVDTPLPALVRFALRAWGEHWPELALDWLESGWPIQDLLDVLADMKDSSTLSLPRRRRALRLWRAATQT